MFGRAGPMVPSFKEESRETVRNPDLGIAGVHLMESLSSLPTMMSLKSEDEEKEVNPSSHSENLHQSQMEDNTELDAPSNKPAGLNKSQIKEEDCGLPEVSSNPEPGFYLQPQSERKASGSSEIKYFGAEMEDGDKDCHGYVMYETYMLSDVDCNTTKTPTSSSQCGKQFNDKQSERSFDQTVQPNVNEEKEVGTKEEIIECDFCGKIFTGKNSLRVHLRIHTGEKPFSCNECGKSFRVKSHLKEHMRIHTGEKPFSCNECGQRFNIKSNLNTHMKIHSGDKPFSCEECEKRFGQKSSLKEHMKTHTGQKAFVCDECGHRFIKKSSLDTHMRIHTGDKPFRCEECGHGFARKSNLNGHMTVHTGEKPFRCEECEQRFSKKSSLDTHMRIHTGDKPFRCEKCGQIFARKSNLNRHINVHIKQSLQL